MDIFLTHKLSKSLAFSEFGSVNFEPCMVGFSCVQARSNKTSQQSWDSLELYCAKTSHLKQTNNKTLQLHLNLLFVYIPVLGTSDKCSGTSEIRRGGGVGGDECAFYARIVVINDSRDYMNYAFPGT